MAQTPVKRIVEIQKKRIACQLYNSHLPRKEGEPIIVFEHGIGGGSFEQLFPLLPPSIQGIEYHRNGLGESDPDPDLQSDNEVVQRLHLLLEGLKLKPPYLLVGHSLGGALIRLFAAKFPDETAGLMLIDPTDFMLTPEENEQFKSATASKTGYLEIWKINLSAMSRDTTLPVGVRMETTRALAASTPVYFKEYQHLPPLKNIPVMVLLAYNKPIEPYEEQMNNQLNLGIDLKPWWRAFDQLRIQHYTELIASNQQSQILLLPGYSHGIHFQDAPLVAKALSELYSRCLLSVSK